MIEEEVEQDQVGNEEEVMREVVKRRRGREGE